jgi:uncharacterized protein YdbL (DUF1318 family)
MKKGKIGKGGTSMKHSLLIVVFIALLLTLACVTVNVYFPAAEVQQAADKIVGEVRGEKTSPEATPQPDQSRLRREFRGLSIFQDEAYAQADINVTTPNIRALKASMKERFAGMRPLYDKGVLGETNDGHVSIRSLEALSLQEKAEANKLVKAENADRDALYLEIAKANNLSPDTVPDIRKLFANSWRKDAANGWWIQKDNGDWVKKGQQ